MGNVQSETTQESETAREGEEKANPDRSKPDRGLSSVKDEFGSQAPEQKAAVPPLSSEPGGGDRPTGAAEMGKNHSKKSKLKLSSMWAQNAASGGIKEASLSEKEPGGEKRGLACLSRADLQSGQGAGAVLQEEPKGLKVALRPAQAAAPDPKDLNVKRATAKGKGKPENVHLAKVAGGLLPSPLPEKPVEPGQAMEDTKEVAEKGACWSQHIAARAKERSENEGRPLEPVPPAKRQPVGLADGLESPKMAEDTTAGPRSPGERSASRPSSSSCAAPPGGKKALLSWGAGPREKEPGGPRDGVPGSDGDSKGPALAAQFTAECAKESGGPVEKPQALGSEVKAGAKSEALGAEAVSSETMQELLEKGLNFLYKVTIQPGQWPPRIKAVKQKASVISSGVSYADVLKQCPQKKSPAGGPGLPKALHHLTTAGKKISSFKGLERSHPEDFSSLSQLFLEHFKKVTPKEPAPHPPGQQVVTFLEELSTANTKRPEWQRPRPPTPYPQRRKGQGRKLPKFGTTVSQVVAFLGSDPKCDWFVHDESQLPLDEAAMATEEGGKDHVDPPGTADKGAEAPLGTSQPAAALLLEPELATDVDEVPLKSRRRPQVMEEDAKETVPTKSTPYSPSCGILSPLAASQSFQREPPPPALLPVSNPRSPSEVLEVLSPAGPGPCAPVGPPPDQKVSTTLQARPKIRKQGTAAAPKSKEKLKASGQPKGKAPEGKGRKLWPRSYGTASPLRLEGIPLFPPFEKVARPFYFGEPLEVPLSQDKPAGIEQAAPTTQSSPKQDQEADRSPAHHWPAFQVTESCSRKCYCKHQQQRKLPKNVVAWLNPSANHLAEPPWVTTAMLAVSLVAGTKFCLDSYEQQRMAHED